MSATDCSIGCATSYEYAKHDAVYATAHDAAEADTVNNACIYGHDVGQKWGGTNYSIWRVAVICIPIPNGLRFGDDGPVISAYLALWGEQKHADNAFDIVIVAVDPDTDYLGSMGGDVYGHMLDKVTSFGKVNTSIWDIGEYNNVIIEQAGLTYINNWLANYPGRSYVILGIRSSRDISETAPAENGEVDEFVRMSFTRNGVTRGFLHILYLDAEASEDIIVSTDPPTEVLPTTANLNGTLTDDGGEACQCGFKWGDTEDCDDELTATEEKETSGTFQQSISELTPGTRYYYKAFATNSEGTGYGEVKSFRAPLEFPSDSMARVSSIRRIYRPGFYRMEIALGDLGFDVDVADTAVKKTIEEVKEPEKIEPPSTSWPKGRELTEEDLRELVRKQQASEWYKAMTQPPPLVSTHTTAPYSIPSDIIPSSATTPPSVPEPLRAIASVSPPALLIRGISFIKSIFERLFG